MLKKVTVVVPLLVLNIIFLCSCRSIVTVRCSNAGSGRSIVDEVTLDDDNDDNNDINSSGNVNISIARTFDQSADLFSDSNVGQSHSDRYNYRGNSTSSSSPSSSCSLWLYDGWILAGQNYPKGSIIGWRDVEVTFDINFMSSQSSWSRPSRDSININNDNFHVHDRRQLDMIQTHYSSTKTNRKDRKTKWMFIPSWNDPWECHDRLWNTEFDYHYWNTNKKDINDHHFDGHPIRRQRQQQQQRLSPAIRTTRPIAMGDPIFLPCKSSHQRHQRHNHHLSDGNDHTNDSNDNNDHVVNIVPRRATDTVEDIPTFMTGIGAKDDYNHDNNSNEFGIRIQQDGGQCLFPQKNVQVVVMEENQDDDISSEPTLSKTHDHDHHHHHRYGRLMTRSSNNTKFQTGDVIMEGPVIPFHRMELLNGGSDDDDRNVDEDDDDHIINYCYGHPDSDLLLLPNFYGANTLQPAPTSRHTNLQIRWKSIGSSQTTTSAADKGSSCENCKSTQHVNNNNSNNDNPNSEQMRIMASDNNYDQCTSSSSLSSPLYQYFATINRPTHEILHELTADNGDVSLSIEFVATRNIQPGEILYIDFGSAWIDKWKKYQKDAIMNATHSNRTQQQQHTSRRQNERFRHEIGLPDGFFPSTWLELERTYRRRRKPDSVTEPTVTTPKSDGDPADTRESTTVSTRNFERKIDVSSLSPCEVQPLMVQTSPNGTVEPLSDKGGIFRVRLPDGFVDTVENWVTHYMGLTDLFRQYVLGQLSLDESNDGDYDGSIGQLSSLREEEGQRINGGNWWFTRVESSWKSDMHYATPDDDVSYNQFLDVLLDAGLQQVLESVGLYFDLDRISCYFLSLRAASKGNHLHLHSDSSYSGVFNLLFPVLQSGPSYVDLYPELIVSDDSKENLYPYRYERDHALLMHKDGYHGTAPCNLDDLRMIVSAHCGDFSDPNFRQEFIENWLGLKPDYPREANREEFLRSRTVWRKKKPFE